MKRYLFLTILCAVTSSLFAYQTGPANRANFGAASQQQPAQGYRAFTNSNNQWRQGVQTKPVQTSVAGSSATEFAPADKQVAVSKKAVAAQPAAKPTASTSVGSSSTALQPVANTAPAMPANMDPTAMLQQVQGMVQGMSNMAGTATGQPAATGGQQNAASTMPAGMPDLSALMGGGMMPGFAPATAPAKK